jgi:hypothetical protein
VGLPLSELRRPGVTLMTPTKSEHTDSLKLTLMTL